MRQYLVLLEGQSVQMPTSFQWVHRLSEPRQSCMKHCAGRKWLAILKKIIFIVKSNAHTHSEVLHLWTTLSCHENRHLRIGLVPQLGQHMDCQSCEKNKHWSFFPKSICLFVIFKFTFCWLTMMSSTWAKQRASSAAFSLVNSSSGYLESYNLSSNHNPVGLDRLNWISVTITDLYLGKSATGQSKSGTSSLWMGLEWVQESEAAVLPWNPPWKLKTDN